MRTNGLCGTDQTDVVVTSRDSVYSLQGLGDAAREVAAMRVVKNTDWVRHLHSRDYDDLIAEFNGAIENDLMSAPKAMEADLFGGANVYAARR